MNKDLSSVVDLFSARVRKSGSQVAIRHRQGETWRGFSFTEWERRSREIAAGLCHLGLAPGERVALLLGTRPEWMLADVAIAMAGGVSVPLYPSSTADQCAYILRDCAATFVVVDAAEGESQLPKLSGVAGLRALIRTGGGPSDAKSPPAAEGTTWSGTLEELAGLGKTYLAEHPGQLEARYAALRPTDPFTIVYTSGTTGDPKGVVLSHSNMLAECGALSGAIPTGETDEQLLFLPLAHIFARVLAWMAVSEGVTTSYARSFLTVKDDLAAVVPTYMGGVPRVYEKFHAGILAAVAAKSPVAKGLFYWALRQGRAQSAAEQAGKAVGPLRAAKVALADKIVFSKLRSRLGLSRVRFLVSGGAPLGKDVAAFFHAIGLLVLEGYGLTETTAATHVNQPNRFRFGTVGPSIPGIETKIAEDGEILVRGGNVFSGYYHRDIDTAEVFSDGGWFHTGDIGVVEDGFLRITDRKKDLIVTSGGKKVAPQMLENRLKACCPYISQVMVFGDKRNFLSALITLNEEPVRTYLQTVGDTDKASAAIAALAVEPAIQGLVAAAVEQLNQALASYETIKKYKILTADFTIESGELTPTLKLKRKVITARHQQLLNEFYK